MSANLSTIALQAYQIIGNGKLILYLYDATGISGTLSLVYVNS